MKFDLFSEPVTMHHLILAGSILAGGLAAGFITDRLVVGRMKALARRTAWEGDDILINALRTMTTWLGFMAGIYFAASALPLLPGIQKNVGRTVGVLITFWVTIFVVRIVTGFIRSYGKRETNPLPNTTILVNISRLALYTIGIMVALQTVGVSITPVLTALGVGGLAVALALQSTLSNLFAGIQILASKNIHPGDYIKLESGDEGFITDITWRATSIRALPNRVIVIPNSVLASTIVNNFSLPDKQIAVLFNMSVSYDSDLKKVEHVTIDVGRQTMESVTGSVPDFTPLVRFNEFGDSGIGFTVVLRAQEYADQYLIKHEFVKALHDRYKKEHIEIPYPVRTIKIDRSAITPLTNENKHTTS